MAFVGPLPPGTRRPREPRRVQRSFSPSVPACSFPRAFRYFSGESANLADVRVPLNAPRAKRRRPSPPLSSDTKAVITHHPVDYSNYVPRNLLDGTRPNTEDFFQGIIHYILFHSNKQYNMQEISLHCAGRQPNSDPASILDAHSPAIYESGNGAGQCLVITFHRIAIRPTALAIRSGPLNRTTRHLTSYVFQGRMNNEDWVVLDERHSMLEYLPGYPSRLSHIDTNMEFNQFRLMQTDQVVSLATHFSLNALEIHGTIRVVEESVFPEMEVEMSDVFDPWAVVDYD